MPFTATDNCESYNNLDTISGLNGGSNWAGAWAASGTGTGIITNSPTLQGSLCFSMTSVGTDFQERRSISAITAGIAGFMMRRTQTVDNQIFGLMESGTLKAWLCTFNGGAGGNPIRTGNDSGNVGSAWVANTNHTLLAEFDCAIDQSRLSINGGAYSSYQNFQSTATSLDAVSMEIQSNGGTPFAYFDDIKNGAAVAAPAQLAPVPISGGIADSGGGMNL